jgi:uncharacterized protein YecE (DUF72 family)
LQYHIGCSGWSYSSWQGPFYPLNIENSQWLSYYSQVFDYVEIDSTFYRMPTPFMVKNWYKRTPDNFRFTAKFPKVITHDKRLKDVEKELEYFFESISGLEEKLLALLIQLPPSLGLAEGIEGLREIVSQLDKRFRYAVEVRDSSWFQDLAYNFFRNNNICMVWSQLAGIRTPPIVTTDFLYIRFIGDRSIDEKDFGKIQKDRVAEMKKWARNLRRTGEVKNEKPNLAIVVANNHYAGFGPGTANMFRKMIGLEEATWKDKKVPLTEENKSSSLSTDTKQTTLSDFLK